MKKKLCVAPMIVAIIICSGSPGCPAIAQGAPQTVGLVKVDPQILATGHRASKVIGGSVVNDSNETVGTIDDLIVTPEEKVPFAVISVGGFVGIGTKLVVVPFNSLRIDKAKITLPGASKDTLKALPDFKYATQARSLPFVGSVTTGQRGLRMVVSR
jgi:hypothetical protein